MTGYRFQPGAIIEGIIANISDAVGDSDRRQAGATTEGTALEK